MRKLLKSTRYGTPKHSLTLKMDPIR